MCAEWTEFVPGNISCKDFVFRRNSYAPLAMFTFHKGHYLVILQQITREKQTKNLSRNCTHEKSPKNQHEIILVDIETSLAWPYKVTVKQVTLQVKLQTTLGHCEASDVSRFYIGLGKISSNKWGRSPGCRGPAGWAACRASWSPARPCRGWESGCAWAAASSPRSVPSAPNVPAVVRADWKILSIISTTIEELWERINNLSGHDKPFILLVLYRICFIVLSP